MKTRSRVGEETLCWTCSHALPSDGCNWSKYRKPVEGWIAEEFNFMLKGIPSYEVSYCPQYDNDSCHVRKDKFWGKCNGNCYDCEEWRDSCGGLMRKENRVPTGEEDCAYY